MNQQTITWQYATNFDENEKRWEEMSDALKAIIRVFAKNTLLQMIMMEQFMEIIKMNSAIQKGDRSEFLYEKAQQTVEEAIRLEEAGDKLSQAFFASKNENNESDNI